jgi:ABC-type xylose transport system permease subunit
VLIILGARLEFSPEWQGIVMGLVLVLAVALDSLLTGRRTQ